MVENPIILDLFLFVTEHVGTGILCGAARTSVPVLMCVTAGSEQLPVSYISSVIHVDS